MFNINHADNSVHAGSALLITSYYALYLQTLLSFCQDYLSYNQVLSLITSILYNITFSRYFKIQHNYFNFGWYAIALLLTGNVSLEYTYAMYNHIIDT